MCFLSDQLYSSIQSDCLSLSVDFFTKIYQAKYVAH